MNASTAIEKGTDNVVVVVVFFIKPEDPLFGILDIFFPLKENNR